MKLKNKIYLIEVLIIIVVISFFSSLYYIYSQKDKEDLERNINNIIEVNRYVIKEMLSNIYKEYELKRELFYKIHQYALQKLKHNPNLSLQTLQKDIQKKFDLNNVSVDIFLLNKQYIVFKTTHPKDLGLNLNIFEDAKYYLNQTKKDNKIYVATNISIDALDSNQNVYSYSKLNNSEYLELGFRFKNTFYQTLQKNLDEIYKTTHNKINLYRVVDFSDTKEIYDNILKIHNKFKSKADYFKSLEKFDKNKTTNNKYINAIRYNKIYKEYYGNKLIVFVPLLKKNQNKYLYYYNLLMTIQIDISSYLKTINETRKFFVIFAILLFILLVGLYLVIKHNFYNPIMQLADAFEKEVKIEDKELLLKSDEIGILAQKYNKLFESLNNEIEKNKKLLEENKRFIADTVHQIRTPLANIMMNSDIIKMVTDDKNCFPYIDQINASINMLTNSYEDLSYLISHDNIEYKAVSLNISSILEDRIEFFSTIAEVSNKKLVKQIEANFIFSINQIELERLIDNNISNAIKYSIQNSEITIRLFKKDEKFIMEFCSYGEKIKNKNRLFEKNYRENESKRGLGLGLHMVKIICEKYNIEYEVNYENNQNIFRYIFGIISQKKG